MKHVCEELVRLAEATAMAETDSEENEAQAARGAQEVVRCAVGILLEVENETSRAVPS